MSKFTFYDYGPMLSRNAVYNFVIGPRGDGKTYGAKKYVIRNYIRSGKQFIYMRRYSTDLKTRFNWFTDIAHEFPDWAFRVNGDKAECKLMADVDNKKIPWQIMGWFIALSTSSSKKSMPYPDVTTIIFDEFIIEKSGGNRYLAHEANVFNDFYSTVDRYQDRVRVLFAANSVSITNPYFIEYDINIDPDQEFSTYYDGFICVNLVESDEFAEQVLSTKFGRFIAGSDYAKYAVGNEFKDNTTVMIGPKGSEYRYFMAVETPIGTFSIWLPSDYGSLYVSDYIPPNSDICTLEATSVRDGVKLISFSGPALTLARRLFANNKATFSTPKARNAFLGLWKGR